MTHSEKFDESGYLVIPDAFSEEEVGDLRKSADFILELLINSSQANGRSSGRLDLRVLASGGQVVRKVQPFIDLSLEFSQLAAHSRLLDPLRLLMQDEPELMEDKITYKQHLPARVEGLHERAEEDRFYVHCDWAYHSQQGYPSTIINATVALDDAPSASGPLIVWPGTHKERIPHQLVDSSYVVSSVAIQHIKPQELMIAAGTIVLFHGLLLHASEPNKSSEPRRMAIFSYVPRSQSIGFDVRNGPTRYVEAPFEWHYASLRREGLYKDKFTFSKSGQRQP